ncbi:glycosyl-4,4'-diaponeurosporenoate acyltransferase [Paenibacillus sp. 1P03SA]|uniref:glycosyl-4,4'-diaponeurosporenoate acyltransferase CrtO family protein n=1 Tax=Paenibacillus sp. 1P03SA TaxID=3132294 RepID=UPI0039A27E1D
MLIVFTPLWTVVINTAAWLFFHLLISYGAFRIPAEHFLEDRALYSQRGWEKSGKFYERVFRIKAWKGLLPDGGDVFKGGFAKKHLAAKNPAYFRTFIAESRRAEFTHYLVMLPAPLFFLWNEAWVGVIMLVYAVLVNVPCVLAQRYNRIRLERVLQRMSASDQNWVLKNANHL